MFDTKNTNQEVYHPSITFFLRGGAGGHKFYKSKCKGFESIVCKKTYHTQTKLINKTIYKVTKLDSGQHKKFEEFELYKPFQVTSYGRNTCNLQITDISFSECKKMKTL